MKISKFLMVVLIICSISNIVFIVDVSACKDIIACGDATAGDYNLLLKVRDPSRRNLQVLCIVPKGYEYKYRHPWTNDLLDFKVEHKCIGVVSIDDVIPNIFKAGMVFSESGIAFGDADSGSNWINPTRYAWDDFDWMRYSCEKAFNEDEAVSLLTEDIVDQMHAPGISENLFVVGSKKAFIIEADAFRYSINEISDVVPMSTYPKDLWKSQIHRKLPIASSFDDYKEEYIGKGETLRLNSIYGVKIVDIGRDWIIAHQVPFFKFAYGTIMIMGKSVRINLSDRETVGDFSVKLLDVEGDVAKISLCYTYKAWEDIMVNYVQKKHGSITVKDMINWSRLHKDDLEGLRPMCENRVMYEAAMIFKIPGENYELLSCGWFSANHPCSSIYVPVHICVNDIYDPYENGDAAALSLELLNQYGHNTLTSSFRKVEDVFIYEITNRDEIACDMITDNVDITDFLTDIDMSIQKQAFLTEEIWLEVIKSFNDEDKQKIIDIIDGIWSMNYSVSLNMMEDAINNLEKISNTENIIAKIEEIKTEIINLENTN